MKILNMNNYDTSQLVLSRFGSQLGVVGSLCVGPTWTPHRSGGSFVFESSLANASATNRLYSQKNISAASRHATRTSLVASTSSMAGRSRNSRRMGPIETIVEGDVKLLAKKSFENRETYC